MLNFHNTFLLSLFLATFLVPQASAMDPQIKEISALTKENGSISEHVAIPTGFQFSPYENNADDTDEDLDECLSALLMACGGIKESAPMGLEDQAIPALPQNGGSVKVKRNVNRVFVNPMRKANPQDIFNVLNASLSFLLTTKEVMLEHLKSPINCDSSFIIYAENPETTPFFQQLTTIDPTVGSLNALKSVFYYIGKHSQFYELARMNQEVLQSIYDNPCYNPNYILLGFSLDLINFVQKNTDEVKLFIKFLMKAYQDEEISQLIKNHDLFSAIVKDNSLLAMIGGKSRLPLQMANNQDARNAQTLHIQTELQGEIDTLLIFKNFIFPDGVASSYRHNPAAHAREYFELGFGFIQRNHDLIKEMLKGVDGDADPRHDFLKFCKDYRSVLIEGYKSIIETSPKAFVQPKGMSGAKIIQMYSEKTKKINLYRAKLDHTRDTAYMIAMQLVLNTLKPKDPLDPCQKFSTTVSCRYVRQELENKEFPIQDLFTTLDQSMDEVCKLRNELGLPSQSFFLSHVFQELQQSLCPPLNILSEEKVVLSQGFSKKTPKKPRNKKKNRNVQRQVQLFDKDQRDGVHQEQVTQGTTPLIALPSQGVEQRDKKDKPVISAPQIVVPQIAAPQKVVPQIVVEKAPTIPVPSMEMKKEIEFGEDYFKALHASYQKFKSNPKNPVDGVGLLLTTYEFKLFEYLKDNVFNNNNRPSWNGIVQDLGGLGFLGKPNTVGNGSTWVFSVTPKNGLFFADENYRYATFNVHCIHGKKGNEPLPIPYLKFFQSGFSHMFGLTKEVIEERLHQHDNAENLLM